MRKVLCNLRDLRNLSIFIIVLLIQLIIKCDNPIIYFNIIKFAWVLIWIKILCLLDFSKVKNTNYLYL